MSSPGVDPWGVSGNAAAPAPQTTPTQIQTAPDPWGAENAAAPQDSPYLGMAEQLEDSAAAVAQHNKAHPDSPVTVDTVTSPAGAVGRYQVMPSTAQLYGLDPSKLTDPAYNRLAANLILQDLHKQFGDDRGAIAVGYNAGPAAALQWLKSGRDFSVLKPETRGYLERATDPWAPDWTAPQPTFAAKAKPSADEWAAAKPSAGPEAKPESSWSKVLSPDFASAWDRLKNAGLGVAQWVYNQNPTMPAFPGLPLPGTIDNLPPDLQKKLAAYRAPVNQWFNKARADVATDIKANAPQLNEGSLKSYTYQTLAGVTDMVPALAAGYVTKDPAVAAAVIGAQAGGSRYSQALQEGRTPTQASMDAQFDAMVNGGLGLLPMHALMAPGGTFLKKTLTSAGAFGLQSVATEALQIGYDKGIVGKDMTLKEAWDRIEQAGIVGVLTGAFIGGGHAGMEAAYARLQAKAPAAPQERREPGAGPAAAPQPPAPPGGPAGPTPADLMAKVGIEKAGVAPPPTDPWAPATAAPGYVPPSVEGEALNREFPKVSPEVAARRAAAQVGPTQVVTAADLAAKMAPLPSTEAPALPAPGAAAVESQGIPRRELDPDMAVTSSGREVPVRYAVVEASHLVPSQTPEGHPNPNFPAELQPRDRTRAVSQAQIASIAQNINPRLLDRSPNASDGAPIVAPSGVVESGNGRSLALQRAYAEGLPSAEAYRDYLAKAGYPVEGMTAPVLVRVREGEMSPQDRQAFVREANQSGQLGYSATERAMTDAAAIPESILDLYRGGDVESAGNRDFVRAFMRAAVPATEHAGMIDQHGALSQDAVRRVRGALLAKAYGDPDLVSSIVESQDSNTKAIGGAMTDVAADWAKMRAAAANGEISPALDQTAKLLEAVKLVAHARESGRNVAEFVSQPDIFSGEALDPDVEAWLRLMFRNTKDWTQPVGRDKLAAALQFYAREAQKAQAGQFLIGEPLSGGDILQAAKARQYGETPQPGAPLSFGEDARENGPGRAGAGAESAAARGGAETAGAGGARVKEGQFGPRPAELSFSDPTPGRETNLAREAELFVRNSGIDPADRPAAMEALANWAYYRGQAYGFESLGGIGRDGVVVGTTSGKKGAVGFDDEITRRLLDPNESLITVHNHPSSMSFSGADIGSLAYPGHRAILVVGHDGHWHLAELAAERTGQDHNAMAGMLTGAVAGARKLAQDYIDPLFHRGELNADAADYLLNHMTMHALDRGGIVRYMGPDHVPLRYAQEVHNVIEKIAGTIRAYFAEYPARGLRAGARRAAETAGRSTRALQLSHGLADVLGRTGEAAGRPGGAPGAQAGAGRPAVYRKPEQLRLLEDSLHEDERTPEFRAWFAGSKVTDAEGKPLVVYHGTAEDFGEFNPVAEGIDGIFFSSSPDVANQYAEWRGGEGEGANVIPAYLSLKNPRIVEHIPEFDVELFQDEVDKAKDNGNDGVIFRNVRDGWSYIAPPADTYVAFEPTQIKSAIGNRGTFNPNDPNILREDERRYSNEREAARPPFYSQLTRSIEESKLTRAPAKDWLGLIGNLASKGVKQEEVDWSGIKDWLKEQTGPVTKDAVLQHLRENEVQVQEVTHGEPPPQEYRDEYERLTYLRDHGGQIGHHEWRMRVADLNKKFGFAADAGPRTAQPTKYGSYALPGGENYRELLLTLPQREGLPDGWKVQPHTLGVGSNPDFKYEVVDEQGDQRGIGATREEAIADARTGNPPKGATFKSSHWNEPNVLAHIRFDDRIGPNGEKILHVAEVQSDWHQKGRKQGYTPSGAERSALLKQENDLREKLAALLPERQLAHSAMQRLLRDGAPEAEIEAASERRVRAIAATNEVDHALIEVRNRLGETSIPNAPFKTSWHELALKRMLRYAAEHGYDRLSWDTGETNADRYDLSHHISKIEYGPLTDGRYNIGVFDKSGNGIDALEREYTAQELADTFGKDVAEKIEAGHGPAVPEDPNSGWKVLRGLDLKVGSEGMRGFYDKILPAAANKIGKKFGAKVEEGRINTDKYSGLEKEDEFGRAIPDETTPVHSLPITPAMRESVMQGQALFEDERRYGGTPLVLHHNLSAENLIHADRMGGLAAPSAAITPHGRATTNFGEITLLGNRDLANPRLGAKVFGADVYSPRYPQITYKLSDQAVKKLDAILKPYRKPDERAYYDRRISNTADMRSIPGFEAYAQEKTGEKYPDFRQVGAELLNEVGATEHLFRGHTYAGNPKYAPHTLENVVKELKRNVRGGENFNYGVGYLRSHYAPQFRSIEAVKKASSRIVSTQAFEKLKEEVNDEFWGIAKELEPYGQGGARFGFGDTVINILADAAKQGLPRALREYGFEDVPDFVQEKAATFLQKLRNFPTEYFEAKFPRAVGLNEFSAAIVPHDVSPRARAVLDRHGIKTYEYDRPNEEDRQRAIAQAATEQNALFEEGKRYKEEPGAVDAKGNPLPQMIIPGAEGTALQLAKAREAAGGGRKATTRKQEAPGGLFGAQNIPDDKQGSLFEDERRYGELPPADRAQLERAARTGNWIGKFGSNGETADEKIRSSIEGAYESWRDDPSVVPPAIGAIFRKSGGLPAAFSDLPTTRPTETFAQNVKKRAAGALDIVRDLQMLLAPMSQGSKEARAVVKDFANLGRLARYHGQRMMEGLKKDFDHNQLRRMWEAADEESVARQKGEPTANIGLSRLTPEERHAVQEQQTDAQNVWNAAKNVGMVEGEGLPSYVPRMMVEVAETGTQPLGRGEHGRSIPGIGRNLRTSTPQMKHRKYMTTEETEAAGSTKFGTVANVVKDIRTLPLATMRLREAVAGRALINQIKEIGAKTGDETVVEGHEPAGTPYKWFTLDHPSFKTWRPKFTTDPDTGKTVTQKDQNGETVFQKVPIYVREDFEGPLRAALSQDTGKAYNGLMSLKGRAMQAIMYSPLIHNAVEWGRALPAMPGKVVTLKIYFEGNAAKRNPEVMTEAIMHGLVPIGHNFGIQDVTSLTSPDSIKAGRSWTAKILGAVPGLFDRNAQQAVYRAVDRMGDIWHNTLLWDRVGDLQMGIYTNMRDSLIRKGYSPDAAQYTAAHFANRYAGALPLEAMSSMARKIANLTLFSRTYTLGNLGAMKDVATGLPQDVQAQIERSAGQAGLDKIKSMARRKAIAILATDIGLFYAGNSILQNAVAYITGRQDLSEIEKGYADRLNALLQKVNLNPLALLNVFQDMQDLSATSENEPGRENRILVGYDHNGTAVYARNPAGKIGEEFVNWLTQPLQTLKAKLGTFARPTYEALTNDAGFGRHVYDPNAHGFGAVAKDVGKIVELYIGSQVPLDSLKSGWNMLTGQDKGKQEIDAYKTLGPLFGVTFSKGAPGGPAAGFLFSKSDERSAARAEALPGAVEKIRNGDIKGARADLKAAGLAPGDINYVVRTTLNPRLRLITRRARETVRSMSPDEKARFKELKKANQP